MEIQFTGQITQKDFLQAQSLHRKTSKAPLFLGGLFICMLIVTVITSISEPALLGTAIPVFVILIIIIAVSWGGPRLQAINIWKNSKSLQKPLSGKITEDKINLEGAYSEGSVSWKAYVSYKQSANMILLYQSPNLMNIFLKTYFKDEKDWEDFKELVKKNVPEKKPTFLEKTEKFIYLSFVILLILLAVSSLIFSLFGTSS
jgi:hypothetical protein